MYRTAIEEGVVPERSGPESTVVFHIGHDELVVRQRYEALSIVNDLLIGLWFVVGSILFFSDSTVFWGTCLFLAGSVQMVIRPAIRISRRVHLQRIHPRRGTGDGAYDF